MDRINSVRNSRGFQYRTSTIWVACHGLPPERPYPGTTWAVPLGCLLARAAAPRSASDAHDGAQGLGHASGKLEGNLRADTEVSQVANRSEPLLAWPRRCFRHSPRWCSARSRGHLLLCAPPPHSVPFFHLDTLQGLLTAAVDGVRGSNRPIMTRTLLRSPYRCATAPSF